MLKELSHPNIMNVFEILHDKDNFYICMEILEGGEVFDRIEKKQNYSEKDACGIIKQVLLAVNYMHQKKIVHRDLKPQNIMLSSKDSFDDIKITDFGFACTFNPEEGLNLKLGSPIFMAPELFKR